MIIRTLTESLPAKTQPHAAPGLIRRLGEFSRAPVRVPRSAVNAVNRRLSGTPSRLGASKAAVWTRLSYGATRIPNVVPEAAGKPLRQHLGLEPFNFCPVKGLPGGVYGLHPIQVFVGVSVSLSAVVLIRRMPVARVDQP